VANFIKNPESKTAHGRCDGVVQAFTPRLDGLDPVFEIDPAQFPVLSSITRQWRLFRSPVANRGGIARLWNQYYNATFCVVNKHGGI
jgi:hypothetical protein